MIRKIQGFHTIIDNVIKNRYQQSINFDQQYFQIYGLEYV